MNNPTPLFPGFHLATLRRKPRSAQQVFAGKMNQIKQKTFGQLSECLGKFIPRQHIQPSESGPSSRRRFYSKENTFWAFFSQVLDADGGCREVVRKLQAYAAQKSCSLPSTSTSAYCQARKKLDKPSLEAIRQHTSEQLEFRPDLNYLNGRRIIVVDGTGVSMPDTQENQRVWPQQRNQKPGCGFPQASICACFCLQTAGLLSYEIGNKKSHELPMLRKQYNTFKKNDIFLGDKGFCSYFDVYHFKKRGVDSVVTLARRKPVSASESLKVLGDNDLLIQWKRPAKNKRSSYSEADRQSLPDTITLRQIKVSINQPGFRTTGFYIVTTLLDEQQYPASDIADLYLQRWEVELYLRDIKTTMGMDILRCKTPEMIEKEILMHFISYNCIRHLIVEVARNKDVAVRRISFKGSIQALRQWEPHLNQNNIKKGEQMRLIDILQRLIADYIVPERPGRIEPRAVKRRPKPYQLLTSPRAQMKEEIHRGRKYAKAA